MLLIYDENIKYTTGPGGFLRNSNNQGRERNPPFFEAGWQRDSLFQFPLDTREKIHVGMREKEGCHIMGHEFGIFR